MMTTRARIVLGLTVVAAACGRDSADGGAAVRLPASWQGRGLRAPGA